MKRLVIFYLVIIIGISYINVLVHSQESSSQTTLPKNTNIETTFKRMTARLTGEIIWKGHDLSHTNVSVYRDEKLKDLYTSGVSRLGTFTLRVEPGRYYLVAYVDVDSSGKFDEGDGYGVLGIKDWNNENQKHHAIEIGENSVLKGIKIPITARLQSITDELKLVPESTYQPSEYQKFRTELSRATSGCRGILKYTKESGPDDVQMLIIAYTDTSWKFRSGMAVIDSTTGKWELRMKPGKYYLMAIVDKNSSNKLDNGDPFGFYGVKDITEKGAFPQPVLIKPNAFLDDLEINISATYTTLDKSTNDEKSAIIVGRVTPFPQDESEIRVEVYDDSTLVNPIATTQTAQDGSFRFELPPDDYYIIANHDVDGNGRYSSGDRLGGLGSDSIITSPPVVVVFNVGETNAVNIQLTAQYDADGQLVAIQNNNITPSVGGSELNGSQDNSTGVPMGIITGRISTFIATSTIDSDNNTVLPENNKDIPDGILSLSTTPTFNTPIVAPLFLEEDGSYRVEVEPGTYYLLAVVDQNNDGRSGTADGIGVYGTHQPVRGTPAAITVLPGKTTPHVDIDILASYVDEEGTMSEISDGGRWNITRMHGQPEDIFKYTRSGKLVEEWMYWTKGIGFIFETDGSGWKLKDKNEFVPNTQNIAKINETSDGEIQNNQVEQNIQKDIDVRTGFSLSAESVSIYYSHDGVLWRIAPASKEDIELNIFRTVPVDTRLAPLDAGFLPSVSENGTLVYHDFDANVIFRDIVTGNSMVYLENRELAVDVTISHDGEYLAYAKSEQDSRKRIVIHQLKDDRKFLIPSTALEMSNPAWRRDGEMLAYAVAGSIENPAANTNRNIYAYDLIRNSVEPIVISPEDNSEPAWHPSDPNTLVFSRGADDKLRQIWVFNVSTSGKRTEQQITLMGGSRPVWVPPNGRWILYENNGQLWTVDTLTPDSEAPLLSNGRVVFGYQPIAVQELLGE